MQHCLGQAKRRADQWRLCKVLVIDEVSMLDAEYLEKVWLLLRHYGDTVATCGAQMQRAVTSNELLGDGTVLCGCDGGILKVIG
jgi:hypothetical protein